MSVLHPEEDARRAMQAMQAGGVAILPNDVGYSLIAARPQALRKQLSKRLMRVTVKFWCKRMDLPITPSPKRLFEPISEG